MSNGDDDDQNDNDLDDVITNNAINSSQSSDKYIQREEPEKIRKWREEQHRLLEQKDAEEAKKKEELKQTAKHELEEWYARYSEQLEKSKLNNRSAFHLFLILFNTFIRFRFYLTPLQILSIYHS